MSPFRQWPITHPQHTTITNPTILSSHLSRTSSNVSRQPARLHHPCRKPWSILLRPRYHPPQAPQYRAQPHRPLARLTTMPHITYPVKTSGRSHIMGLVLHLELFITTTALVKIWLSGVASTMAYYTTAANSKIALLVSLKRFFCLRFLQVARSLFQSSLVLRSKNISPHFLYRPRPWHPTGPGPKAI